MEINIHDIELYDPNRSNNKWESLGKFILWGSSIIAATAFIPALAKKKRIYTPIIVDPGSAAQAQTIDGTVDETAQALQCSPKAKDIIERLWTQLADGDLTIDLRRWGNELENDLQVHPFAMFLVIPRDKFRTLFTRNDYYYRITRITPTMWGIERGMRKALSEERPYNWPRLWTLIPSFASQMNKDEGQIRKLIQGSNWRGLIDYLFDI